MTGFLRLRARTFPVAEASLILLPILIVACGTVPREGLIIYHEPPPTITLTQRGNLHGMTQIFATAERELAEENSIQTHSGVIEGAGDTRDSMQGANARIIRKIFQRTGKKSTRVISPEKFAQLWTGLRDAGLFKLPAQSAEAPPRSKQYFLIDAAGSKELYVRPSVATPAPEDPGVELMEYWRGAKFVLLRFLNEP